MIFKKRLLDQKVWCLVGLFVNFVLLDLFSSFFLVCVLVLL